MAMPWVIGSILLFLASCGLGGVLFMLFLTGSGDGM